MGFFKDFKDDLAEAADELIPGGMRDDDHMSSDISVGSMDSGLDVNSELSKLDGLLEQVAKKVDEPAPEPVVDIPKHDNYTEISGLNNHTEPTPTPVPVTPPAPDRSFFGRPDKKERKMSDSIDEIVRNVAPQPVPSMPASDENAVITAGMTITGDLDSAGSIELNGIINGNVRCNGKFTVTGTINGNSTSSEFFADSARVTGEVNTSGTVKIGVGSVVIGNITASSAVIAGAVKGDIDVQGPVVVDTSAVVMGNIKSRSVQINNGAVIEGFCSQAYADVDVSNVFA